MSPDFLDLYPGVRLAAQEDLPRILEIERLSFEDQWTYHQFESALKEIFLVFEPETIQGFLIACTCDIARRAIIMRIAVHPEHRGQGIASRLIHAALDEIKSKNLRCVELDVDIVKNGAIRLYEKFGFKTMKVATLNHDDDEVSFLIMKLLLRDS
jgi:[ribosomal protein S18]-alanine N-acetyltransferase